jgi:hypothetical protein
MSNFDGKFMKVFAVIVLIAAPIVGVIFIIKETAIELKELKCVPTSMTVALVVILGAWLRYLYMNQTSRGATTDAEEEYSIYENEWAERHKALMEKYRAWDRGEIGRKEYFSAKQDFDNWNKAEQKRLSYVMAGSKNFSTKFRK